MTHELSDYDRETLAQVFAIAPGFNSAVPVANRIRAVMVARDNAEAKVTEVDAALTSLVLRDVADHLAADESMTLAGEWLSQDRLIDNYRPARRRSRRWYDRGRRTAMAEAVRALRWVAERNDER